MITLTFDSKTIEESEFSRDFFVTIGVKIYTSLMEKTGIKFGLSIYFDKREAFYRNSREELLSYWLDRTVLDLINSLVGIKEDDLDCAINNDEFDASVDDISLKFRKFHYDLNLI